MLQPDDDYDTDKCAALNFERLDDPDDELLRQFHLAPWTEECIQAGITLRLAAIMLRKTKAEMVEAVRELGSEHLIEFLDRLLAQEERFSDLAAMLASLKARLVVAGSVVSVEEQRGP